ncbi:conserved hypothetical protein [Gammaproteobacteria bacterium]
MAQDATKNTGDMAEIKFTAEVIKVQTMERDYAIRLTLDLAEDETQVMAMLAECKRQGIPLTFIAKINDDRPNNTEQHRKRKF